MLKKAALLVQSPSPLRVFAVVLSSNTAKHTGLSVIHWHVLVTQKTCSASGGGVATVASGRAVLALGYLTLVWWERFKKKKN